MALLMSAAYLEPKVALDVGSRAAHAEFQIRNDSGETWRASEGFRVGYHLFDAETGTLIEDGPRTALDRDLQPGESASVRLDFELPQEDGRYQVLLSPMREDVCWYYERDWRFLLVEASTSQGAPRVDGVRVADRAMLRSMRNWRAFGRAFVYPITTVWKNRGLIRVMVRRDIVGRYRGSIGGTFWTVINPLLLMLTYFFVFGVVLNSKFPGDPSRTGFALYYLAGVLPWLAFSEAAGRAPSVMIEHRNFVKKLVFAVETLPVNLVVSGLVSECFAILLFCGFLLAVRHGVPLTVAWLPALLIPQLMFTAGVSWFLAALGVFVRDLGQIMAYVLTIWFFATPICYPETQTMPEFARVVLGKNPIYVLVRGYRAIFLEHHAPSFSAIWKLWVVAGVVLVVGHAAFYRVRKMFADML